MSVTINRNADDEEFDEVVTTLLNNEKARVGCTFSYIKSFYALSQAVVLFVDEDKTRLKIDPF